MEQMNIYIFLFNYDKIKDRNDITLSLQNYNTVGTYTSFQMILFS